MLGLELGLAGGAACLRRARGLQQDWHDGHQVVLHDGGQLRAAAAAAAAAALRPAKLGDVDGQAVPAEEGAQRADQHLQPLQERAQRGWLQLVDGAKGWA